MFTGLPNSSDDPLDLGHVPSGTSRVAMAAYRLSRVLRFGLSQALSGPAHLSLAAWRICLGLADGTPVSQRDLVAFTDMEQAQVSRALQRLIETGLIGWNPSKEDGRVRLFHLTEAGKAQFQAVAPAVSGYYMAIDAALSPQEQAQFVALAQRIATATLGGASEEELTIS